MEGIIYFIGKIVSLFLVIYAGLYILYHMLELQLDSENQDTTLSMPSLRPVHIPTKSQTNPVYKFIVFIFEVRKWELVENWRYKHDGVELLIPKGFRFDGASIPRPFWAVLNPIGLLLIPGLLHDYAYKYDQLWQVEPNGNVIPYREGEGKDYWDHLFKKVGKEVNGFFLINAIAWLAVALGGSGAWDGHRKANLKAEIPD